MYIWVIYLLIFLIFILLTLFILRPSVYLIFASILLAEFLLNDIFYWVLLSLSINNYLIDKYRFSTFLCHIDILISIFFQLFVIVIKNIRQIRLINPELLHPYLLLFNKRIWIHFLIYVLFILLNQIIFIYIRNEFIFWFGAFVPSMTFQSISLKLDGIFIFSLSLLRRVVLNLIFVE